jgi:hypothetical protein
MSNTFERYRLRAQALREKRLSEVFPFKMVLPGFAERLYSLSEPFSIEVKAIFDDSSARNEAVNYASNLARKLSGKNVAISSDYSTPGLIRVWIKKRFEYPDKKEISSLLDSLTEDKNIHHARAFALSPYDKEGKLLEKHELYFGDPGAKSLISTRSLGHFPLPKQKIIGETTYLPEFDPNLKERIKEKTLEILGFTKNKNKHMIETIMNEAENRLMAYIPLVPAGIEARQKWRVRRPIEPNKWSTVKIESKSQIREMIDHEDAFALYAKLKQEFKYDDRIVELPSRLVQEAESDTASYDYQARVFRTLVRAYKNLGIPMRISLSGKDSYRVISEIDVQSILQKTDKIFLDYPWIEEAARGPVEGIEEKFNLLIKVLTQAMFLYVWNMRRGFEEPKITLNKYNIPDGFVLLDVPHTVNIITAAPKMLMRMDEKIKVENRSLTVKKILEDNFPEYKGWDIPYAIMISTPMLENEALPTQQVEFLVECNSVHAIEKMKRMKKNWEIKMKDKLTAEHVSYVLKNIPRRQFHDLNTMPEYQFREKHKATSE